ncbi:MAG: hypothetical protein Q7S00_08330, partial [bacterium]|nr:hypothetical protein [bacterium]
VVDDFSKEGSHDWCDYGGDHRIAPEQDENCPEVLPINCVNPEEGTYCFPGTDGECRDIDLSNEGNSNAISLFATDNGGIDVSLTSVSFAAPCTVPETLLIATFLGGGETTIECMYSCNQPGGFTAPANFDFEGTEGEGGQNQVPAPCEAAGATTQEACEQICSQPQHKEACRFNPDA